MAHAIAYKEAIRWIANNDDTEWIWSADPIPSVSAVFVADIYSKDIEQVHKDIRKAVETLRGEPQ